MAAATVQTRTAPAGAVELRWSELGSVVGNRRVTVELKDGGRVTGDVVVVRDEALVIETRRAAPISRTSIAWLELETHRGAGRHLGTVLGVLTGVVIGGWVAGEVADSAGVGIPLFLGVAAGITLTGYQTGKAVSRHVTLIRIVDA